MALTPAGAKTLQQAGHGTGPDRGRTWRRLSDAQYLAAGATIVSVDQAWDAELVLKVKEPLANTTTSKHSCCLPICIWPGCRAP